MRYVYSEAKFEFNDGDKPKGLCGVTRDIPPQKPYCLEMELQEQQRIEQLKLTATAQRETGKRKTLSALSCTIMLIKYWLVQKYFVDDEKEPVKHADYPE